MTEKENGKKAQERRGGGIFPLIGREKGDALGKEGNREKGVYQEKKQQSVLKIGIVTACLMHLIVGWEKDKKWGHSVDPHY